jgi:branched-chain amino acid transport system substrate-binding protein
LKTGAEERSVATQCGAARLLQGIPNRYRNVAESRRTAMQFKRSDIACGIAVALATAIATSAQAQFKFGVGAPITGGSAAFGAQIKNGVEQAIEDINAAGGILGQKLVLEIGDDRADPKEGVSVANKFAADGVKFVIGHFNSGVTIPASDVYRENGMLAITPGATNPGVTDRPGLWNMFRTCGRDDQQGGVAGGIIAAMFKGKRVAMVHDKTTYGQGLAQETRKAMNAKGVKEVMFEGVNKDDKDFTALVSKVKAANPDLVYWGGLHDTGGLILRQMRDQGVKTPFMGGDGITDDEFAAIAGPGAEGTLMTFAPDPRTNPKNKAIVELFRTKRGFEPQAYTLYSYAAVQIIKQAAEAAKSLDPRKVADAMHSGKAFDTVLGDIAFDKKGDVSNDGYVVEGKKKDRYVLYTWKKGPDGRITYFENE